MMDIVRDTLDTWQSVPLGDSRDEWHYEWVGKEAGGASRAV